MFCPYCAAGVKKVRYSNIPAAQYAHRAPRTKYGVDAEHNPFRHHIHVPCVQHAVDKHKLERQIEELEAEAASLREQLRIAREEAARLNDLVEPELKATG